MIKLFIGNEDGYWWIPMAVGAGAGLLKHELVDKPQHKRMQNAQAEITKYSPWTGMQGKILTPPSAFGSIMQGLSTGAMMSQMGGAGAGASGTGGAVGGGVSDASQINVGGQFQSAGDIASQQGSGGFWNRLNNQGAYSQPAYGMGPYLSR